MNRDEQLELLEKLTNELVEMNVSMEEMKNIATLYFAAPTAVSIADNYSDIKDELHKLKKLLESIYSKNDLIYKAIEEICLKPNAIKIINDLIESDEKITIQLSDKLERIKKKGKPFDDFGLACCSYYFKKLLDSKDPEGEKSQKKKLNFITKVLELFEIKVPKRLDKTILDFENYLLDRKELREALDSLYDTKFRH